MDWQTRLISVYLTVRDMFDQQGFSQYLERMSNIKAVLMTDQELPTIYLFAIMSHRRTIKQGNGIVSVNHRLSTITLFNPCSEDLRQVTR